MAKAEREEEDGKIYRCTGGGIETTTDAVREKRQSPRRGYNLAEGFEGEAKETVVS